MNESNNNNDNNYKNNNNNNNKSTEIVYDFVKHDDNIQLGGKQKQV